ncbi:chitin deacetylase 8-like [Pararge aegeria]|uniref:Jg7869 protein n=1 Tax=Pararge aegeria aegeria TaxID=348720 RepID=A0A8S4S0W6_9NEOP|nr:chitin deacetylase 8-like [Pararge aegeria]CAH2244915.1 jg7869 [Pararge aegeria aegeria]
MRSVSVAFLTAILVVAYAEPDELPLAEPCDESACKLPNCLCSSQDIPGNLEPRDTPQFVLLTFDDAITDLNTQTYRSLIYRRTNKNQCPIGVTFFMQHEYTDYVMVNELYNQGFEIGLHSISHRTPQDFWRDASYEQLMREIGDQKQQIFAFANVPASTITGVRSPFLQLSGNNNFKMMKSAGITYDLSRPTTRYTDPGMWPYTLDYQSTQDCVIGPCPNASFPGAWVIPMISWTDLSGFPCAMADACFHSPDTEEGWFQFILQNFERHYLGNRAPFGIYIHEAYIRPRPHVQRALTRFFDTINNINDVFMVNAKEVIDWTQNPIPINEYVKKSCRRTVPAACRPVFCPGLFSQDTEKTYYLRVCSRCPRNYPWVNNPLGN